MISASIPSRWFTLHPSIRMDAGFWIRVKQRVKDRKVNPNDLSKVRDIIMEVEHESN